MNEADNQVLEKLIRDGLPIFEGIDLEEIKEIIALGHTKSYDSGEPVIKKNNTSRMMFILLSGLLEIRDENLVVRQVEPGEIIGELAFLLSSQRSADVFAGPTGASVLCLDEANLQKRLLKTLHPGALLLLNLSKIIAQKLATATRNLRNIQQQLVQQEKLAALGQLTSGIAHELKNPLNFVNNFASLNKELALELLDQMGVEIDPEQAEFKETLGLIRTNSEQTEKHGKRANAIVESMMAHARDSSGKKELVNLIPLVETQVDLALQTHKNNHQTAPISLNFDFPEQPLEIFVSPQDISRALLNILINAIEAVCQQTRSSPPDYHPSVSIRTRRDGKKVMIQISDNGPGLPEAKQDYIFEPFYTTKSPGSGIGLGLSISYDIITHGHGGTLSVESSEGQGATFTILLPAKADLR